MASCIEIINAFLKWFSQEYGKGSNDNHNGNGELIKCRALVKELEAQLNPPAAPIIKSTISASVIKSLYTDIFPKQKNAIYISDNIFEITAISELRRFVDWDNTNLFKYTSEYHDCEVNPETAYGEGLFFADGSCTTRFPNKFSGDAWRIVNRKLDCLERAKAAFESEFPEFVFPIRQYDSYKAGAKTNFGERKNSLYCLEVAPKIRHNDGSRGGFIKKFRATLYNRFGEKKIPAGIIESPTLAKRTFLEGAIDGNGSVISSIRGQISCSSWQAVGGLMDLMLDNNWNFYWRADKRNPNNYTIYYNYKDEFPRATPACDDFALALAGDFAKFPGWSSFPVTFMWGSYYGGHAFCTAVAWPSFKDRTPAVYFIEPQNDWEIALESVKGTELWLLPMSKVGFGKLRRV